MSRGCSKHSTCTAKVALPGLTCCVVFRTQLAAKRSGHDACRQVWGSTFEGCIPVPKLKTSGIPETTVYRIPLFMKSLGPYLLAAERMQVHELTSLGACAMQRSPLTKICYPSLCVCLSVSVSVYLSSYLSICLFSIYAYTYIYTDI